MKAARHIEGRAFGVDEYASMRTVGDVTREELLANPLHPKLEGDRHIKCECGHSTIGEHNDAVREWSALR